MPDTSSNRRRSYFRTPAEPEGLLEVEAVVVVVAALVDVVVGEVEVEA